MKNINICLASLLSLAFFSCTEDFSVPTVPQTTPQENILSASDVTVTPLTVDPVDYNEIDSLSTIPVAVISVKNGQMPANSYTQGKVQISLTSDFATCATVETESMASTDTIYLRADRLQSAVFDTKLYEKDTPVTLYMRTNVSVVTNETSTVYIENPTTYFSAGSMTYTPAKIAYQKFLYYVGTTNGWNIKPEGTHMKIALTDISTGTYEGYIYQKPESYGNTFKLIKNLNDKDDWSTSIGASAFPNMTGDVKADGDNFYATGATEPSVYYVKLVTSTKSITVYKINYMSIIGGSKYPSWDHDQDAVQFDAENYCYVFNDVVTGPTGWKFRTNHDWGNNPNLGGTVDNLTNNGDNLTAEGTTVKLYPCRTNSDNIYCTVK